MKSGFLHFISRLLSPNKVCVLSEDTVGLGAGKRIMDESGMSADYYDDYKALLANVHRSNSRYDVACIYRNGSVTKPTAVANFLKQNNADIKTIVFTNTIDLRQQLSAYKS